VFVGDRISVDGFCHVRSTARYDRSMTTQQAILIGAGIIAASIVGARVITPYVFSPGMGADGNAFDWRSNLIAGNEQICRVSLDEKPPSNLSVSCTP